MADFPDTSFEQLPLPAKRRIDAACARFESAWREGRPTLEAFFGDAPPEERDVLFAELLLLDVEYRRRCGEAPRPSEYARRFPQHEAVIRAVLPPSGKSDTGGPAGANTLRNPLAPAKRPAEVPGYELLEELGRGGMGVVYKARHLALNRMVALKFILAGTSAPARHIERFRREAEVVARLRHPNIVQIYDIGEVENQAFLALEYAEGGSLRERLAGQPMEPRAAALILEPCARAVQHAHRQGVIHRDLKPANILLAVGGDSVASGNRPLPDYRPFDLPRTPDYQPPLAACTPKITDFGLARMLDSQQSGSELGIAAGTPQYMAPEQATGDPGAGPLIDVWALGVTLYELLTGRPPFRAATSRETLRLLVDADPVPPTQLQPSVPRDLETICLKCLEKEPSQRYAGARELAHDLRRFLDGEPILARRVGRVERLRKWARRRPYRALALVALLALLLSGATAATTSVLNAHRGWDEAKRGADHSEERARRADDEARGAREERAAAERLRLRAEVEAARLLLEQAGTQGRLGAPDRAAHDLLTGLPLSGAEQGLGRALRANLKNWLPYVHPLEQVVSLQPGTRCVALGPGGVLYAGGDDGVVRRFDANGQPKGIGWKQADKIRLLSLSRDGTRVLVGEPSRVVVRDVGNGNELGRTAHHPRPVTDAVFAADGKGFFTACEDGAVRRWTLDGERVGGELAHPMTPRRLAVSPDGAALAVALGEDAGPGSVWLWRVGPEAAQTHAFPHPAGVWAVAFHPGGGRVFSGCNDGRAREWDVGSAKEVGADFDHGGELVQVEVTPDGRSLLTVSREEVARLWEVPTRQPIGAFPGVGTGTRLSSDGGRVVAVLPSEARLHALARPLSRLAGLAPREHAAEAPVSSVVFSDGKRILYTQPRADPSRGLVWVRDVQPAGDLQAPWEQAFRQVTCVALDPAGKVAAVGSRQGAAGAVQLWDAVRGQPLRQPWRLAVAPASIAFRPDGKEVAAGGRGGVRRWATGSGEELPPLTVPKGAVTALTYRPDGDALAVGVALPDGSDEVRVLPLGSAAQAGPAIPHPSRVASLEFRPDGQTLLVGGRTARLWVLDQLKAPAMEVGRATVVRFARGGQSILVGTGDGQAHRYRASGEKAGPAVQHPGAVLAVDLSPDGKTLLVGGREGTLRLWDVDGVPRPLGPPLVANRPVAAARFRDDGASCVSVAADGEVRVWPVVRGGDGPVEELERRVLAWTGREIDAAGLLTPLSFDRWSVARVSLDAEPPGATAAAWHDARARDARQDGDLFGERWHLDRLLKLWPGDRSVYRRRAVALARLGLFAEARADLKAAGDIAVEAAWAAAACEAAGDREAARWFAEARRGAGSQ